MGLNTTFTNGRATRDEVDGLSMQIREGLGLKVSAVMGGENVCCLKCGKEYPYVGSPCYSEQCSTLAKHPPIDWKAVLARVAAMPSMYGPTLFDELYNRAAAGVDNKSKQE